MRVRKLLKKPLVLIGMIGSGKSTVGKRLAYKLNMQFYDSDKVIEEREGFSVSDIFDFRGEEYFRQQEVKIIKEIMGYGTIVLSTGGESFANQEIRESLLNNTIVIWLKTDIEKVHERVARRNTRPQVAGENKREIVEKMAANYYPIFSQAHITLDTKDMDVYFVIDTLLSKLHNYLSRG